ncbi:MAG: hypothetical protein JNJ45_10510 [Chthonomonas sp.]|nr:hypothetical protein [Chthonomonas sp.]
MTTGVTQGALVVTVAGTDLKSPKELRVMRDTVYIAEFEAALAGGVKPGKVSVRKQGVEYVQYGWYTARPPKVRVSIRLTDPALTPLITKTADGFVITIPKQANAGSDTNPLLPNPAETPVKTANQDSTPLLTATSAQGAPDFMSLRRNDTPVTEPTPTPLPQPTPKPQVQTKPQATPPKQNGFEKDVRSNAVEKKRTISLDFVATDVNLVLKALALQSGANIVTAPNMKGTVTVSIANVPLDSALDFVTVPSGLRWERVRGTTYVVAPKEKIREIVNELSRRDQAVSTTLIVPIYSGDIRQIRETVTRAFIPSTSEGSFEMLLSSEISSEKKESSTSESGGGSTGAEADGGGGGAKVDPGQGGGGGGSSSKSEKSTASLAPLDNLYMILIGNDEMVSRVRDYITQLDRQICASYGIEPSVSSALVTDTYTIRSKTLKAKAMIDNVSFQGFGPAFPKVALHASPETGERQSVIIVGRESEVARAKQLLAEFDGVGDNIAVYDLKFSDPRSVRDQVMSFVPGLQVDFAPAGAGAPRLYEGIRAGNKATSEMKGDGGGGDAQDVSAKGESKDFDSALSQPFNELEKTAQPMRLILRGSPEQITRAAAFIERIDLEPKQVAIDVRVVELSRSEALKIGIDWSMLTGGIARSIRINQNPGRTQDDIGTLEGETRVNYNLNGQTGSLFSSLDQLDASGRVISRPNLLAMDGRESETFIGETIRYVESIQSTQNGVTVTTASIGVGIRLAVIPRIGADGKITLDMRPVIRSLKGFTSVPGGGQLPQTVERVMTNTVMVNSGETIALGGLITDTESKTMGGIPLLKDIPLLGRLFSRETKNRDRRELVFFITVREVNTENRGRVAAPRDAEKNNGLVEEQTKPEKVKKKG